MTAMLTMAIATMTTLALAYGRASIDFLLGFSARHKA